MNNFVTGLLKKALTAATVQVAIVVAEGIIEKVGPTGTQQPDQRNRESKPRDNHWDNCKY